MASPGEAEQLARAFAGFVRAELAAPAHLVADFCDVLIADAEREGLADYLPDLRRIKEASDRLGVQIGTLLDDTGRALAAGEQDEQVSSRLRHDLRTPISAILGYGEMLLEIAQDEARTSVAEALTGLLDAARKLLGQIDVMVDRLRDARTGGAGAVSPEAAAVMRSLLANDVQAQPTVGGRILVVDDNTANLDLISRRLAREGHDVTVCESGRAALALLAERPFDLVLLDLIMPDLHGLEVLAALRADAATASLPVIMISAMDEVDGVVRCIEAGAEDFLPKPLEPTLLRVRINAALERKRLRDRDAEITERLRAEQQRSESLLLNMLPVSVVERLRIGETAIADLFESATILFCDLVGFTAFAARQRPEAILDLLNEIFSEFDRLAARHGLEKIKTIGDGYMVAGGVPEPRPDHAAAVAAMALEMPEIVRTLSQKSGQRLDVRLGLHTGPVVAGIIGRQKFAYDVWGDTVNTASRMERHGVPGRVHISAATREALGERYRYEPCPLFEIKGKGAMATFLIV